jgi:hypothetical protein
MHLFEHRTLEGFGLKQMKFLSAAAFIFFDLLHLADCLLHFPFHTTRCYPFIKEHVVVFVVGRVQL